MYGVREHTADLIVWAQAKTPETCLEEAALALREVVTGRREQPHGNPDREIAFRVEAPDRESLVVAFMSELLWLLESEDALWHSGGVTFSEDAIEARCNVVTLDASRHGQGVEVKAVTYHELQFGPTGKGWELSVLLDI